MKKPYIKKLTTISKFNVYLVDGGYIRNKIDEEFTNFGNHYEFSFIPKKEFWIDKENSPGEEKYYIEAMLTMYGLMSNGMSRKEAGKVSDRLEKKERAKSELMKNELKKKKHKDELLKDIHKKLIKNYSRYKIKVWIVNGELVRDLFFLDFTEGGHDKVYSFIPENEVWLDDDLSAKELKFVLLHEIYERNLMAKGMSYENAHKKASEQEFHCRMHPEELIQKLNREFKK